MERYTFAEPPISDLRWKAPKDPAPWSDVLQALEFKPACFQRSSWGVEGDGDWGGSEDCLYLNVWTPELTPEEIKDSKTQLPVMMWIHGGANVVGSAHVYDPSLLVAKHKVVVVTIQYRMGPLGWFRPRHSLKMEPQKKINQETMELLILSKHLNGLIKT